MLPNPNLLERQLVCVTGKGGVGKTTIAAGLALFAHVIVYPVTDYRPDPRPASLVTVVLTVSVYGAIALGT